MKYKRGIPQLTLLLFTLTFTSLVQARETKSERILRREIHFVVARSKSPRTIKAIDVYSKRQRKTIYHSYSQLLLQPASNLKIVTTSFALHSLGDRYLFTTPFEFAGVQRSDSLLGDLVVVGKGDPIISENDLDSAARAISGDGITTVTGDLVIDVSRFDSLQWGNGWMWDDEPAPYAMFIGPAELNHDVVDVSVSPDSLGDGLSISITPQTSFIEVRNEARPGDLDSLDVTRELIKGTNTIIVTGTYTRNFLPETYQFSVRHPAHYFGTVFRELLTKHGVTVLGKLIVTRTYDDHDLRVQAFTLAHDIDSVVTYTNKNSDNLGAECILRQVPMESGEVGSAVNAIKLEKDFLTVCGVDTTQYHIVDGSGVSHYNLITPNAIVHVLRYDLEQPYSEVFVNSLPIAGVDGTLNDRMTQDYVSGKVHAKTGSIAGVRTLSGYVFIPGDTLVFSMMMQNMAWDSDSMRTLQDSICTILTQYSPNSRLFVRNLWRHRLGTYGIDRHRRRALLRRESVREKAAKSPSKKKIEGGE